MSDPTRQFKKDIEKLALSEDERRSMEKGMFSYMAAKPLPSSAAIRSPFSAWFFSHRAFAAYAMAFILTFVTVASAAEGALPGDSLYLFKINVNESIIRTAAVSDELKARTHIAFTERRLLEMEKLLTQGRGEDEIFDDLLVEIDENAESVHIYTDKIRQEEIHSAVKVQAELNAVVDTHAKVMKKIAAAVPDEESVSEAISHLEEHGDRTEETSEELEIALVSSDGSGSPIDFAEEALEESMEGIEGLKELTDFEAGSAHASTSEFDAIRRAEEVVMEGEEDLRIGNTAEAIENLNEANDIIRETELLLEAEDDLKIDIDALLIIGTSSEMTEQVQE